MFTILFEIWQTFYPSSTTPRIETQALSPEAHSLSAFYPSSTTPRIETWQLTKLIIMNTFFLPIIHYTKDWNTLLRPDSGTWLETFYPSSTTPRIETKLRGVHLLSLDKLSTHHPLHQGLKLVLELYPWSKSESFYPSSTTPRIETHGELWQR